MIERPNSKAVDRKGRLALPATRLPIRDPEVRIRDFGEACEPWDLEAARAEAERCIQCPAAPCVRACPLGNDIPYALWLLEHRDIEAAASVFRSTNTMPEVCGRVCPQSELCEGACVYARQGRPPVAIGRLEAFVADRAPEPFPELTAPTGRRAAVVGAGPAGLTVAEKLAVRGHAVTVYDAWPAPGGILRYGIPTFKMSHRLVDERAARLETLGVRFVPSTRVGRDVTVEQLFDDGCEAVFLGIGAGVQRDAQIEGVDLPGVYQATPFLVGANVERVLRPDALRPGVSVGRRAAVVGGGDTAMDCVRTALRLGAEEVTCWYRRTEREMPGNERDRDLARQEGARFEWLVQPTRLLPGPDGRVTAMECVRMRLGEPDSSGRRRPVKVAGTAFRVEVDTVILALGYLPDGDTVHGIPGLEVDDRALIETDPRSGATSREGLYAGGDAVLGPALVVTAVQHGMRAAEAMHRQLTAGAVTADCSS
ncbi:MAG: NAD(P)-dependent oxidoreductase [Candidatus Palauibacterales bacterium]|nr:NAD(P)-dependent oxidoreductase [Candidatus Palauibacterales bacterium]MDP2483880.1 NAD(P)-dependent oxidoreductase [Candidatus Palauibacterales bacterium]